MAKLTNEQRIEIYQTNSCRYGYRRIILELKNQGFTVNHKKVLRLMNKLGYS